MIILTSNLVKQILIFMSNYTNMQYERNVSSVDIKLMTFSQGLITVGKLFHRVATAPANEPSPALVWVRFASNMFKLSCDNGIDKAFICRSGKKTANLINVAQVERAATASLRHMLIHVNYRCL